jgi:hypothetical protein
MPIDLAQGPQRRHAGDDGWEAIVEHADRALGAPQRCEDRVDWALVLVHPPDCAIYSGGIHEVVRCGLGLRAGKSTRRRRDWQPFDRRLTEVGIGASESSVNRCTS